MKSRPSLESRRVKIVLIGLLVLLLQLPIALVSDLISSRTQSKVAAENDIARIAGQRQSIGTPVLTVPYLARFTEYEKEKSVQRTVRRYASLAPDLANIKGSIAVEKWNRGVFDIPTYILDLTIDGSFSPAFLKPPETAVQDILWDEAYIVMGLTDSHTVRGETILHWNNTPIALGGDGKVIKANLPHLSSTFSQTQTFSLQIKIGGTSSIYVAPVGRNTKVNLSSTWPHPTFVGSYLPVSKDVTNAGFNAIWQISELARAFPSVDYESSKQFLAPFSYENVLGVDLFSPVDAHRMTGRAIQYQLLFLFLTFMIFFLFEVMYQAQIHPVQYLIIGAALVLFFLLVLGLCDHLSFGLAYLISTFCSLMLITCYSLSVLKVKSFVYFVFAALSFLYFFLYSLLKIENYAFLTGAVGLTLILAVVMFVTRNVDWYETFKSDKGESK